MRFSLTRWIAALLLPVIIFGWTNAGATAQATPPATPESEPLPRFGIHAVGDYEHAWFDLTISPGDAVDLTARISNSGEIPAQLRTYSTNAVNPANGGFSAGTEDDEPTGATLWLAYPTESMMLAPGESREVDFTLSVPADTLPGQYFVALVVQTEEPLPVPGTEVFNQIIRNTVSVEITVPGDMTSGFELGEPAVDVANNNTWIIEIPITNTGTARVKPQGELLVTSAAGDEVSATDVEMGWVYGGNTTSIRVGLPAQVPAGDYVLSLELSDEVTGASDAIENAPITLEEPEIVVEEKPSFEIDAASVTANAEPVQYADVAAVITNNGAAIPTANVTLNVMRDGEEVESYPLAQNQALPQGTTDFSQRYIPIDGWESGTYTFELIISAVSGDTETVIATVEIPDEITVP